MFLLIFLLCPTLINDIDCVTDVIEFYAVKPHLCCETSAVINVVTW